MFNRVYHYVIKLLSPLTFHENIFLTDILQKAEELSTEIANHRKEQKKILDVKERTDCGGKPGVDCDYWSCKYCNYWGDEKVENVKDEVEPSPKEEIEQQKTNKEETVKGKTEDIRDVYMKEMQDFLGEDPECNIKMKTIEDCPSSHKDTIESSLATDDNKLESIAIRSEGVNIEETNQIDIQESLVRYGKEEKIQNYNNERYEKSFDGSTVQYETFTYDHEEVIKLDEKLHQFIEHLKTADPKEQASMEALGVAKQDVRNSHTKQSSTRKDLNADFVGHLQNTLQDSMKSNDLSKDDKSDTSSLPSPSNTPDTSSLSLVEQLAMLEKIQNSVQEEKDLLDQEVDMDEGEDRVEAWLKSQKASDNRKEKKKKCTVETPKAVGQTPWEVVENDTISDLSETFASVVSSY